MRRFVFVKHTCKDNKPCLTAKIFKFPNQNHYILLSWLQVGQESEYTRALESVFLLKRSPHNILSNASIPGLLKCLVEPWVINMNLTGNKCKLKIEHV